MANGAEALGKGSLGVGDEECLKERHNVVYRGVSCCRASLSRNERERMPAYWSTVSCRHVVDVIDRCRCIAAWCPATLQ